MTGTIRFAGGSFTGYSPGDQVEITIRATISELAVAIIPIPTPGDEHATVPGDSTAKLIGVVTDIRPYPPHA